MAAVAAVCAALLAIMLGLTVGVARLARLNRGDTTVLLFCGSKKSLPMALSPASGWCPLLFGNATVGLIMLPLMIFHQIQLIVCAIIASRMSRTTSSG